MSSVKKIILCICIILTAASCGLLFWLCLHPGGPFGLLCCSCILLCAFAVVFIYITDPQKPPVFAALYVSAILISALLPAALSQLEDSLLLSALAAAFIIAVLAAVWAAWAKISRAISRSQAKPSRSAGTGLFLHIVSFAVTALCSLTLCFLINFRLFLLEKDFLTWPFLIDLSGRFLLSAFDRAFVTFLSIILIIVLLTCNGLIYRHAVRKIFEHYSIVFISAGAISLLFMFAYSQRLLYFTVSFVLLFTGAVLMLFYVFAYHAQVL